MYRSTSPIALAEAPFESLDKTEVHVERLSTDHQSEVLEFLSRRPVHTVTLVGFIRDNGLVNPLNRGTFYSCRNRAGLLEGVSLIGHATLMETTTDRALEAFAELAKECFTAHMIMGESERIDYFWRQYEEGGRDMRLACRELLYELKFPIEIRDPVPGLRQATLEELQLVIPVQAQMALEESGTDPLEKDSAGFLERCARRIQQGRTWVVVEDGVLLFKADVVSETEDVAYLEGIWINPANRGRNVGLRCMSQLGEILLAGKKSICLLVNEKNSRAHGFYQRAGYKFRGVYDTLFLSYTNPQRPTNTLNLHSM
ncbi:MAG TPA: GNAT family N-acetyltransferase [Pyrinomonadaceae bacterium]|nr:GNAT family N-acetyltransferase [Pyrinomonadaceae bacterium]